MKVGIWFHIYFHLCILFGQILGQEWITYDANLCLVGTNLCNSADLNTLRAVLYANGEIYSYTLDDVGACATMANPNFDVAKEIVIYIYGYTSTNTSQAVTSIRNAFAQYGTNKNFFMAFTDKVYGGIYLENANYIRAAQETVCVGERIGNYLIALHRRNVMAESIHLIGHSLGAQAVHAASQRFLLVVGIKIGRSTGLDPAGPCFDPNRDIQINSDDAVLVDIIHTNAGPLGLGTATRLGMANFMPNGGFVQTGCGINIYCSHIRAPYYYAESLSSDLCIAAPAGSFIEFNDNYRGQLNSDSVQMGHKWNGEAGSFYMYTNGNEPYCKGNAGVNEDTNNQAQSGAVPFLK